MKMGVGAPTEDDLYGAPSTKPAYLTLTSIRSIRTLKDSKSITSEEEENYQITP